MHRADTQSHWRIKVGIIPAVRLILRLIWVSFADGPSIVLLEAPFDPLRRQMNSVLLTVDLTKAVADEAIERNDSIIVAYRTLSSHLMMA